MEIKRNMDVTVISGVHRGMQGTVCGCDAHLAVVEEGPISVEIETKHLVPSSEPESHPCEICGAYGLNDEECGRATHQISLALIGEKSRMVWECDECRDAK